jgi:antitoxin component YwqK of YwqJK toxin-antitoxin module
MATLYFPGGKYPDQKKESEGKYLPYERGKKLLPHGPWRWWYKNGQLRAQGTYDKGNMVGDWRSWSPEGKPLASLENGTGEWLRLHPSGDTAEKGRLVGGKKEGKWTTTHPCGHLAMEGEYRNGKQEGKWVQCDKRKGGFHRSEMFYRKGFAHGGYRKFGPEGQLRTTGHFENGSPHGVWTEHYIGGEPKNEREYVHGVEQPYLGTPVQGTNHVVVSVDGFSEVRLRQCCRSAEDALACMSKLSKAEEEFFSTVLEIEFDSKQGMHFALVHWKMETLPADGSPGQPSEIALEALGDDEDKALEAFHFRVAAISKIPWTEWARYDDFTWGEDDSPEWKARSEELCLEDIYWLNERSFMVNGEELHGGMWEGCGLVRL